MRELKFSTPGRSVQARGLCKNLSGLVILLCCALFVASGVAHAQAGRRVTTPKSDPPVPKPAEPAQTPKPKPKDAEKVSLVVGTYASATMARLTINAAEMLQGAVVQRLRDSETLDIASAGRMTRGEANKRAKGDTTKTYVVWLDLQSDSSRIFDPAGSRGMEDFYIEYVVLEPVTGKVKSQGSVYLRPTGSSRLGRINIGRSLPHCYPQGLYSSEFALVEAGIATAERIFRAFSLPNPPHCS